jgi:hypothetical protein
MPREAFLRKRYAFVRWLDWAAAKGSYGPITAAAATRIKGCDDHDHARVGFNLAPFAPKRETSAR